MALDELALAAAGIDNQADTQRQFRLAGEELNLLSDTVFKDFEIIAAQRRDKLAISGSHATGNVDERDIGMEARVLLRYGNRCKHEERNDESEHAKVYYVSGSAADSKSFQLTAQIGHWLMPDFPGFPNIVRI